MYNDCYCKVIVKIKNKKELKMKRISFYFLSILFLLSIYIYDTLSSKQSNKRWKGCKILYKKEAKNNLIGPDSPRDG